MAKNIQIASRICSIIAIAVASALTIYCIFPFNIPVPGGHDLVRNAWIGLVFLVWPICGLATALTVVSVLETKSPFLFLNFVLIILAAVSPPITFVILLFCKLFFNFNYWGSP